MMTAPDLPFLESDRIIFKLYACEQHLRNIKNIKSKYGDLLSKDARVSAELEIDSLISQMIGTFDCLLFRIIDKFQLSGIPRDKIEIDKVLSVLSAESHRVELATELAEIELRRQLVLEGKAFEKLFFEWFITFARCFFRRHSLL